MNSSNLTYGMRRLKFETHLAGAEETLAAIAAVAQNFAREVRNEVMNDAVVLMRRRVVFYIQEGKRFSRVPDSNPRSYNLASTFTSYYTETDTVQVSIGDGVPYALMHNLPIGQTRTIYAKSYPFMLFHWYRISKHVAAQAVERPGIAYWDRALEDVKDAIGGIIKKQIEYHSRQEGSHISRATGAKLRGRPRLKYSARTRSGKL